MFTQPRRIPFRLPIRSIWLMIPVAVLFLSISFAHAASLGRARFTWEPVANPVVSGYKIHWGTESGVYTHTFDAGNASEATIAEFAEGVEYFSAVSAYSNTGEESDYSTETSFVYDSTDRMVLIEAESGNLTPPMEVAGDGAISWIASPTADGAAAATLDFSVPYSSDFFVWCRVLAPSEDQDSFFVKVDDQPEEVYEVYGQSAPHAAMIASDWTWSRIQVLPGVARAYPLQSGLHQIRFRFRENALLDRIVVVSNPDFVPSDALPRSGDFVQVVNHPQDLSVAAGAPATLSATFVSTGPVSLQWLHNGNPLANSTQSEFDISSVSTADVGQYQVSALRGSATTLTSPATLSILPGETDAVFRVRNLSISSGSQVTFQFAGAIGSAIGVYASPDLINWTLISTQTNTGESITINDPEAAVAPKRFYRLADAAAP